MIRAHYIHVHFDAPDRFLLLIGLHAGLAQQLLAAEIQSVAWIDVIVIGLHLCDITSLQWERRRIRLLLAFIEEAGDDNPAWLQILI